jgi:hypothetical protein
LLLIYLRTVPAPYVPASTSASDASNFDQEGYEVAELDDTPPSNADQLLFADFSDSGVSGLTPFDQHPEEALPDDL